MVSGVRLRALLKWTAAACLLAAAIIGGLISWIWGHYTSEGPLTADQTVYFAPGSGVTQITDQLVDAGVLPKDTLFPWLVRMDGKARRLQAGEFLFPAHVSAEGVADILTNGKVVQHKLTIVEGVTVKQVLRLLGENKRLSGAVPPPPPEGWILPETYLYTYGQDRGQLLDRMVSAMGKVLHDAWAERQADLPLKSPLEALILASIVERETALAEERPLVAGVFINRLRKGMRLQSDPTVVYALSDGEGVIDRPLRKSDLQIGSLYNTYRTKGLPPTPIALPGEASIKAVVNPAETKALYFVANGKGGHAFAETLQQHNRNVRVWRSYQKQK